MPRPALDARGRSSRQKRRLADKLSLTRKERQEARGPPPAWLRPILEDHSRHLTVAQTMAIVVLEDAERGETVTAERFADFFTAETGIDLGLAWRIAELLIERAGSLAGGDARRGRKVSHSLE
jgi:hypothetical protein